MNRYAVRLMLGVTAVLIVTFPLAGPAQAQQFCQEFTGVFFDDDQDDCRYMPDNDRTHYAAILEWSGRSFLYHSTGNDLEILSLANPASPSYVDRSSWHGSIGNQGDNDYGLEAIAICDDCRYGVSYYRLATVYFDMGTGSDPNISTANIDKDASSEYGFTFKHGGTQFLVGRPKTTSPCTGAGLYIFDSVNVNTTNALQCLDAPDPYTNFNNVDGGRYLQHASLNGGAPYIWTTRDSQVAVWEVTGTGANTRLQFVRKIDGMWSFGRGNEYHGFDVDLDERVGVSFDRHGFVTWQVNDLANPSRVATNTETYFGNIVALNYPMAFTSGGGKNSGMTWDVSNLGAPQVLDPGFWSTDLSWNQHPCDLSDQGAVFSPDGNYLYASRFTLGHTFNVQECTGPSPPSAGVLVEKRNAAQQWVSVGVGVDVYPGDEVRVSSTSGGEILNTTISLKDASGSTVASSSGGSTATPAVYTIPLASPSTSYTAEVFVQNDVGQDTATASLPLDLQPAADIDYTPIAPLTGEDLTLSGSGEGTPQVPVGGDLPDPFEWLITPPSGDEFSLTGATPEAFNLDEAGTWTIGLTVHYAHGDPSYDATDQVALEISSVSAALSVSPLNPVNTANITLDATDSRMGQDVTSPTWTYDYRPSGAGSWINLNQCSPASDSCTIPGNEDTQFFTPGDYDFRVTLANPATQESSTFVLDDVTIADGSINLDFTISDTSPDIGQGVDVVITGVAGVDSVTWNFGGTGCSGYSQTVQCTPNFINCMTWTHKYATSGTKTITLTATVDGQQQSPVSHQLTVSSSGTCGGGGGGGGGGGTSCSYSLSPASRTVPNTGGTGYTVNVNTQAGCNWTAARSGNWINIQAGSSGSGPGTVLYEVLPNQDPSERAGAIIAMGQYHTITQNAANIPTDFTVSVGNPVEIGQEVTFTVSDDRLVPTAWEFGGSNCEGTANSLDCTYTPDFCRSVTWSYRDPGWKTVRLVTTTGEKQRGVNISNQGECCLKDAIPDAGFSMAPNPVFAGEDVTFTADTAPSKNAKTAAVGITYSPQNPIIGETVTLTITGIGVVDSAEWDYGEDGCGTAFDAQYTCTPYPGITDCLQTTFQFTSGGTKTVDLTINGGQSPTSTTINVQSTGECPGGGGGGGGGCSYTISPTSRTFDEDGGSGTFTVNTGSECDWTPQAGAGWINVVSGNGPGSGTVSYQVAANSGAFRQANISVANKNHSVRQDAMPDDPEPQDSSPDSWLWTVTLDDEVVVTSTDPIFTHAFDDPGQYDISLEVENCVGSATQVATLQVDEPPVIIPTSFVVPSAVHTPGLNATRWLTDLRIFNPDTEVVTVDVEFQPENTDNAASVNHGIRITIPPNGTRAFDDILSAIPGIIVDDDGSGSYLGSLSIEYENGGEAEAPPLIMSRTYNITDTGTFGQFVPAVFATDDEPRQMHLSGLVHNLSYRTNVRLANLGEARAVATIRLYDKFGEVVGDPVYVNVEPKSTTQVNGVAEIAGIATSLDIFSVTVDSNEPSVVAWASLVDNVTGDPVLYSPIMEDDESTVEWIPGVAHLPGANFSQWSSDISFYNPGPQTLTAYVEYIPSEDLGIVPYMEIRNLGAGQALYYEDVLGISMLPAGVDSKGFIVVESDEGVALPQVSARTYNVAAEGGTFGQNLKVFRPSDLITTERRAFIPGVVMSPSLTEGFRTNLGVLNVSRTEWAQVRIILWGDQGGDEPVAESEFWIEPHRLWQSDLAERLGLDGVEATGTLEIQVLQGEGVVAYESVVDNLTQDPILVPAVLELKKD